MILPSRVWIRSTCSEITQRNGQLFFGSLIMHFSSTCRPSKQWIPLLLSVAIYLKRIPVHPQKISVHLGSEICSCSCTGTWYAPWSVLLSYPTFSQGCVRSILLHFFLFSLPLAAIPANIIAAATANSSFFSHVYFWCQKFSSRCIWNEKLAPEIRVWDLAPLYGAGFWRVCRGP